MSEMEGRGGKKESFRKGKLSLEEKQRECCYRGKDMCRKPFGKKCRVVMLCDEVVYKECLVCRSSFCGHPNQEPAHILGRYDR